MIRTKGEAGTGDVVEAVRHSRTVGEEIARAAGLLNQSVSMGGVGTAKGDAGKSANAGEMELRAMAKEIGAPYELLRQTAELKRLPVVNFAAGGVATPADAALMMQLGCDGVFVGSGIFKSGDAPKRARAIVQAVTHYRDPKVLAEVSTGLGEAMVGINCEKMADGEKLAKRGW